jgi:hypothetical protein
MLNDAYMLAGAGADCRALMLCGCSALFNLYYF